MTEGVQDGVRIGLSAVVMTLKAGQAVVLTTPAEDGARAALVVDVIHGQRQVVIKSLEANYRHVPGVAAATILGDGRVALILDVAAIVRKPTPSVRERELIDA